MAPAARLTPFTVNAAVGPVADAVSVAVPSTVFLTANATMPAGALLPLTGFTTAVNTVDPVCAMPGGFAVAAIEVPIVGDVTVTATVAIELLKLLAPV